MPMRSLARLSLRTLLSLWTLALAWPAAAAPGPDFPADSFRHAEIRDQGRPGNLEDELRALVRRIEEPAWVAYAMPRIPRSPNLRMHHRDGGAGSHGCGTYYLEGRGHDEGHYHDDEIAASFLVLLRVAGGEVQEIRAVSTDCDVDAGGLDVHAFSSVEPRHSIDLLVALAEGSRQLDEQALFAVALHDEPAADDVLRRVATGDLDWREENQAVFWLGAARGQQGFEILRDLARNQDDSDLRQHITFGIYVSKAPESVDALIEMARHDASRKVRRQAVFWLAQEASRRAVEEIDRVTEEDPDVDIKKHAVFALSQLPADQGVPLLIRHARTHPHPVVRKQAIFWLGQSDDDRAFRFIEELLLD